MSAVTAAKQQIAGFRDDVPFSGAFDGKGIGFTSHRPKRLDRSYVVRVDLFSRGDLNRTLLCVVRFYRRSRALVFPRLTENAVGKVGGDVKTNSATIAVALLALMLSGTALSGEQTAAPAQTTTTTNGATSSQPGSAPSAQPSATPAQQSDKNAPEISTEETSTTFKVKVNLVEVRVVVRDAQGHAVGSLKQDEIDLHFEGGGGLL